MTREEAIKTFQKLKECTETDMQNECNEHNENCFWCGLAVPAESTIEACDMAIAALKNQMPKKPIKRVVDAGNWKKVCPACGRVLMERITTPEMSYPKHYNMTNQCSCGQAIDWREQE